MHRASRETHSWNRDPTDTIFDLELREFVQRRVEPAETEIVIPYHASVWSRIFHLPADATMIGLQYMDVLLDADKRYSDLRYIIGHGNAITLGVMAAIWWFIIFRVLYDISAFLLALIRAAFTPLEDKPYG